MNNLSTALGVSFVVPSGDRRETFRLIADFERVLPCGRRHCDERASGVVLGSTIRSDRCSMCVGSNLGILFPWTRGGTPGSARFGRFVAGAVRAVAPLVSFFLLLGCENRITPPAETMTVLRAIEIRCALAMELGLRPTSTSELPRRVGYANGEHDGWGTPVRVTFVHTTSVDGPICALTIRSAGPDRIHGTSDDIVSRSDVNARAGRLSSYEVDKSGWLVPRE